MKIDCGAILIVDPDERFREFAVALFERVGFETKAVGKAEEALAAARQERPGLVLLEVRLPDVSGFQLARALRGEYGDDLPIVFVSEDRTDPLDRATGLLIGGDDYLVKPADGDELLARVQRLISRSRRREVRAVGENGSSVALTLREQEVLQLLAEGMSPKQIALELVVSPKTIASHLQRLQAKLGVHSRSEAVAVAYRDGFVRPGLQATMNDDVEAHSSGGLLTLAVGRD